MVPLGCWDLAFPVGVSSLTKKKFSVIVFVSCNQDTFLGGTVFTSQISSYDFWSEVDIHVR